MNQHTPAQAIAFIDIVEQRHRLGKRIDEAVAGVLTHCQFINGPEVARLEEEIYQLVGERMKALCVRLRKARMHACHRQEDGGKQEGTHYC